MQHLERRSKILLWLCVYLSMSSCTAATLSLDKCYTACDRKMAQFEMRGDPDDLSCGCQITHTVLKKIEKKIQQ